VTVYRFQRSPTPIATQGFWIGMTLFILIPVATVQCGAPKRIEMTIIEPEIDAKKQEAVFDDWKKEHPEEWKQATASTRACAKIRFIHGYSKTPAESLGFCANSAP
jgi:hypothetical protein